MRLVPALAALAALCSSCSVESPVASLADATLIPGTALGPVELGRTTLRDFVTEYGEGSCALVAGDEFCGIELAFESQEIAFLWEIDAREAYALSNPPITHVTRGVGAFLDAHPQLGAARLHSLSVQAGRRPADSFYQGSIDGRAKLFAGLDSVLAYFEKPENKAPGFVAGASEHLPELCWTCFDIGLTVYLVPSEEGGEPVIDRMTIFSPGGRS